MAFADTGKLSFLHAASLFASLFALLFPLSALAQSTPIVAIHGFDKMSCQDWFGSEGNPDVRQQYIGWIRGVVTGYNYANPDDQVVQGRMPTDFSLVIFVDNYCHRQKSVSVAGAAFALIGERRSSSAVSVLNDDSPAVRNPKDVQDAKDAQDAEAFSRWLARQSDDIKSLDKNIQMKIFKKESGLSDKSDN